MSNEVHKGVTYVPHPPLEDLGEWQLERTYLKSHVCSYASGIINAGTHVCM